jgi:hypothetical protein
MPDPIDPASQAVKAAGAEAMLDCTTSEAQRQELLPRDEAVLRRGKLRYRPTTGRRVENAGSRPDPSLRLAFSLHARDNTG